MRFSENFKLNKAQIELDFVDIPLDTDIALFIDPHVIATREDLLSVKCNNIIVNFFQTVVTKIREGDDGFAKYMLGKLSEPNQTHFGLSSEKPQGRGVGDKQSLDVYKKFRDSEAVKTGFLKDLSDTELVIEGIGSDKISDMTTNIIKKELIEYTQDQCKTYGIPTKSVPAKFYWEPQNQTWKDEYVELPVYNNESLILVPKVFARYQIQYNHQQYYNNFVLIFLQKEHINANSSLVRLLKSGEKRVYKKDLKNKEEYKLSKEFLYDFSNKHPEVLADYAASISRNIKPLTEVEIETRHPEPKEVDYRKLKEKLQSIPAGRNSADAYHTAMIGILEAVFSPNLYAPTKEEPTHKGRKVIDITFLNGAKSGFFEYLINHIPCSQIICECKNYSEDPANPELDQLSGRFSPRRGRFGFLLARTFKNKDLFKQRCRDTVNDDRGFIVALDDDDILQLIDWKATNNQTAIDTFLTDRYKELIN